MVPAERGVPPRRGGRGPGWLSAPIFLQLFSYSGRRPETYSVAGQRDRKSGQKMISAQALCAQIWCLLEQQTRDLYEQRHFYANNAKTEMRHFCLKSYKTRYTSAKRDTIKNPQHGQDPEREQNEIGTRFAYFEAMKGQDTAAFQDTLGFSLLVCQMSWNTSKTRYTPRLFWDYF